MKKEEINKSLNAMGMLKLLVEILIYVSKKAF